MPPKSPLSTCTIDGCDRKFYARGWCEAHYKMWKKWGDPIPRGPSPGSRRAEFERLAALETDECVIWPHSQKLGYGHLRDCQKTRATHIIICERRHGPRPAGMEAAHTCGLSLCMNYRHLRWSTKSSNEQDKVGHGTSRRGSRFKRHRWLTEDEITEIQAAQGETISAIARRFNVSRTTILRHRRATRV